MPMVGFKELLRRLQIQEQMTKQHQTRVDVSVVVTVPAVCGFNFPDFFFLLFLKGFNMGAVHVSTGVSNDMKVQL